MELADLRYEHFTERVGHRFRTVLGGETVELEVMEAEKAAGQRADNAFSVVFRGPHEPRLMQRMYDIEHPDLGVLSLFLVPVGHLKDGMLYEAVFTRLEPEPD